MGKAIKEYLEKQNLLGDVDIAAIAGAVKNLVSPEQPRDTELVLKQIQISHDLHHIKNVILMNHTDCGGYGGRKAFASDEAEKTKHTNDLRAAARIINQKFPNLVIRLVLAKIATDGDVVFEEF